jgi:general secretion pathway protein K
MASGGSGRSGMALILTLAAIVAAGGIALFMQARAASASRAERLELEAERLRAAAAEAAREIMWVLASDEDLAVDHLGEEWARPIESTHPDGISTWAAAEDAGRFFNWNNLALSNGPTRTMAEIAADLMVLCGDSAPSGRIDALVDYLDEDEEGGWESEHYAEMDPPSSAANRPLWAPEELLRVSGFGPELFARRFKSVAEDPFQGDLSALSAVVPAAIEEPIPVNVNTASRELLMALMGFQPRLHEDELLVAFLRFREREPIASVAPFTAVRPELAASLAGALGTGSEYFRVRSRASLAGLQRTVTAWVRRDEAGDVHVLQWIEGGG